MNEPLQGEEYTDFIRRIRQGDERAAEELIRRYEPEIRLEIRTLLRLRDPRLRRVFDSMDICQSVMVSFFLRAAVGDFDLDEPSQLIRLLVGMARNRLAERVRFHQRHRRDVRRTGTSAQEEWTIPAESESPSEVISRNELLVMFRGRLSGGGTAGCRAAIARARLAGGGPRAGRHARGPPQAARPRRRPGQPGARARPDRRLTGEPAAPAVRPAARRQWSYRGSLGARFDPFPRG